MCDSAGLCYQHGQVYDLVAQGVLIGASLGVGTMFGEKPGTTQGGSPVLGYGPGVHV